MNTKDAPDQVTLPVSPGASDPAVCGTAAGSIPFSVGSVCTQGISPTKRQAELLAFIKRYMVEHGVAPTYYEMAVGTGFRHSIVARLLRGLIERGRIRRTRRQPRAMDIIETVNGQPCLFIPKTRAR